MIEKKLTLSERKTVNTLYKVIGRKISESRKSSRRKFEGISKKLNISVDVLKKIESGDIENIEKEIPLTGFIRAYAKITDTDISDEIDKLQSDYAISQQPRGIRLYQETNIKMSKIFLVFLTSFCFLLLFIFVLSKNSGNKFESKMKLEDTNFFEVDNFEKKISKNNIQKNIKSKVENFNLAKDLKNLFEISFLEETWIEVYSEDKNLIKSGLYNIGEYLNFNFERNESDFFIKSGNLGGFQIIFKGEFFAPFGYSGETAKGFYLKEKISNIKEKEVVNNER